MPAHLDEGAECGGCRRPHRFSQRCESLGRGGRWAGRYLGEVRGLDALEGRPAALGLDPEELLDSDGPGVGRTYCAGDRPVGAGRKGRRGGKPQPRCRRRGWPFCRGGGGGERSGTFADQAAGPLEVAGREQVVSEGRMAALRSAVEPAGGATRLAVASFWICVLRLSAGTKTVCERCSGSAAAPHRWIGTPAARKCWKKRCSSISSSSTRSQVFSSAATSGAR